MNVDVRIRWAHDVAPARFTSAPVDRLEDLIASLRGWGVSELENLDGIVGQFVVTDREAYFEIVIGGDE